MLLLPSLQHHVIRHCFITWKRKLSLMIELLCTLLIVSIWRFSYKTTCTYVELSVWGFLCYCKTWMMKYNVTFHHSHKYFSSKKNANQGANQYNTYNFSRVERSQRLTYLWNHITGSKCGRIIEQKQKPKLYSIPWFIPNLHCMLYLPKEIQWQARRQLLECGMATRQGLIGWVCL